MKTIQIEYPESIPAALNLTPESFEEEARLALAIKLFELGRLSSGQAAALAGMPRVTFLVFQCTFYLSIENMKMKNVSRDAIKKIRRGSEG